MLVVAYLIFAELDIFRSSLTFVKNTFLYQTFLEMNESYPEFLSEALATLKCVLVFLQKKVKITFQ